MSLLPLSDLCLKTIIVNIKTLPLFIYRSPLPWKITQEVIKNYSKYKWIEILEESLEYDKDSILMNFEFKCDFSNELRNALITSELLEPYTLSDSYCVWSCFYIVKDYNLRLCESCFRIISRTISDIGQRLIYTFDHYHQMFQSENLHLLYNQRKNWCYVCNLQVLFQLKERCECIDDLHNIDNNNKKMRFTDR